MNTEMIKNTRTQRILKVMYVLAWIAFVGLSIDCGAMIVAYIVSVVSPEFTGDLYKSLNLSSLYQYSFLHYTFAASFIITVACMKAHIAYLLIRALSDVNMANPFKIEVVRILEKISIVLIGAAVVIMIGNAHAAWLLKQSGIVTLQPDMGQYVFVAGLVFIISQVFRRGVEIQTENDLTV